MATKGQFRQNGKTWEIDTKIKVGGVWKHFHRSGYPTLQMAKADFEKVKNEYIENSSLKKIETFNDLVDEYETYRSRQMNISTIENDKCVIRTHLLPYFGGKSITQAFDYYNVRSWYNRFISDLRTSNARKSKVITRLKDILNFAYRHKYIGATTYQDADVELYQVKYSKKPLKERVIWTADEEARFIQATKSDAKDYLMFRLFLTCSPRLGEFLGLQPNCFDKKHNKIIIKQQIKYVTGTGKPILTDVLKTHDSYRSIIIPQGLADELDYYIISLSLKDNDFLFFANTKSTPMGRTTFKRKLKKYCILANVPEINPHASRHMMATKLASVCHTGQELESAARRLGHSPSMFMDTYANHANDKTEEALLERMN